MNRIEWFDATNRVALVGPDEFEDGNGSKVVEYAFLLGFDSTIVIEGPLDELDGLADRMKALVAARRQADASPYARAVSEWGDVLHDGTVSDLDLDPHANFLLVESNRAGGYTLSTHDTMESAAMQHDSDEYAEDWTVVKLIDLNSGAEYSGITETRTTFVPAQ